MSAPRSRRGCHMTDMRSGASRAQRRAWTPPAPRSTSWCSATRAPARASPRRSSAAPARPLAGVEVAYYLIHSMEAPAADFAAAELRQAERFAAAAAKAGVRRVVYLGGLAPQVAALLPL